jgi:competence protein ComEC
MTRDALDLRLAPAALAAWAMAAWGVGWSVGRAVLGGAVLLLAGAACVLTERRLWRDGEPSAAARSLRLGIAVTLVVGGGALAVSGLRAGAVHAGPVPRLAIVGAEVQVTARVTSDPVRVEGTFSPYVVVRLTATAVTGRGETVRGRSPLLVIGDLTWMQVRLGEEVVGSGRLSPAQDPDLAAVLLGRSDPRVTGRPAWAYRAVSRVRAGLKEAAAPLPPPQAALVPALVDGDDADMPADIVADFKITGLTHLLAVSGSNLSLVLGFVMVVARWCRVRARGLLLVGLVTVVFFVLLARPQPSVLRAAAMGLVALAGLSVGGRSRGTRALSVAVIVLVLLDPWLARSVGFLLSSLATAGILLLAPGWRDAMARWMPLPLAEAVAVPMAAQLVCTPAIAAISSQVSLVAIAANLLVAPAVGPTTVAGLLSGVAAMVSDGVGHLGGRLAGVPAWWIIEVARRASALRGATVGWPVGPTALAALTLLCLIAAVLLTRLLGNRFACLAVAVVMVAAVVHPPGRFGWPPRGWLLVACDVGQGDGLVLNAGAGVAVVVDTGPDPRLIDACLNRLKVTSIALVVLTHFHADHADGLSGVLRGRAVHEIEVSPLSEPADRAATVRRLAARAGVPVTVAVPGERRSIGQLSWQVLGPLRVATGPPGTADEASDPNNASVVMRLDADGHSFLLAGDAEPEEQEDLMAAGDDLAVDVLKVAHHGSENQDPAFVAATSARIAVISVGADNDYGHPSPRTLALLRQLGAQIYRTDLDGDIAIVVRAGQLATVTSKG